MAKRALITGSTSQDGWCLGELPLHKGYEVLSSVRRVEMADDAGVERLDAGFRQ